MQFNQVLLLIALAATSAIAGPPRGGRPQAPARPQPPKITQSISCSSGSPFCCSPATETGGTTCVALIAGSVQCNAAAVCCNNNDGAQACSNVLAVPINFQPSINILGIGGRSE